MDQFRKICQIHYVKKLYLTYKELRHIAVNGTAYFWHDAEVMLYLTYKELVVCLCLSPRAPKKRANSYLLGA